MLTPLSLTPSFGFGDRLGLATPGHIASVKGTMFAPIFAQQSVRENARTGRTPQQVIDDAKRAVEAAKWDRPWGADADHLKTVEDIHPFVEAGYTFFTVDPGEYVDNSADTDSIEILKQKVAGTRWDEISALYLDQNGEHAWGQFAKSPKGEAESLMRATVKYGQAIRHAASMFNYLSQMKDEFDFEVSVDETAWPTTPLDHFYIANELTRLGVRFTSLAPRFIGGFEKGVDYIGDLNALDAELTKHAAVTSHFGTYKLSLHSGSDKFSVYPLVAKHWGERIHVKTAGTSYLEALRVLAKYEPDLFTKIYSFGRERYETDRKTYHVSAQLNLLPHTEDLASLLNDFHAREVLHVTFGSALAQFGVELKSALIKHEAAYYEGLKTHFDKHLRLLKDQMNLNELQSFYNFTGRTVLVTGGAGVLGLEIVRTLVECNATVVILSRNQERAKKLIAKITKAMKSNGHAICVRGDVLDLNMLQEANETVRAEFGKVDILINVAGGNHPSAITRPDLSFFDLPLDMLRHVSDLNLLGTILPCQVFGRGMAEHGEGVILNISSMSALRPLTLIPAYSAAKAAVSNFTQWLAVHMAQNYSARIQVNAIAPGFFLTEQNRFLLTDKDTSELTARGQSILAHTPMNRFGIPEDLLGATMWLISPAASFVTGAVIPIDGGFSAFSGV